MTYWLLAVILMGSEAGLGLRQGAIRVAFSFLGILMGAVLAIPLGPLLGKGLGVVGVHNDMVLWLVPPVIVFAIILILFKVAGLTVHKKVEVFYKYKAGDLRLALWERMNSRLGLCLAMANGVAYLILITFPIYVLSYWTVQMSSGQSNPFYVRTLTRMGLDMEATGMTRVARAVDGMPKVYYEVADLVGEIFNNPPVVPRLAHYPPFLEMAEQSDFQGLLDKGFSDLLQTRPSIPDFLNYGPVASVWGNSASKQTLWAIVKPNLQDLFIYITNGVSPKYESDKILGRWDFDVSGTVSALRRSKPTISSTEMGRWKRYFQGFTQTTLLATTTSRVYLKNYPHVKTVPNQAPVMESLNIQGGWRKADDKYEVVYTLGAGPETAQVDVDGDRLTMKTSGPALVFQLEE